MNTPCPHCGNPLEGLERYCWSCREYTTGARGLDPTEPAEPAQELPDTRSEDERKAEAKEPVGVTIPWGALASDNLRKGLDHVRYAEYKTARDAAHALALTQVPLRPWFGSGSVRVMVRFWLPDHRRRDPNNLTKMLCDALTGVAYTDDAQIRALSWDVAGHDPNEPRAECKVESIQTLEGT